MISDKRVRRVPLRSLLSRIYPEVDRERLFAAVLCGEIVVNGERLRNPGIPVLQNSDIAWVEERFVGRGGYKLEGALYRFGINPAGLVCLDAGASTGGFTDCLLSRGAAHVYAVDVGFNQLAWKLRKDPRVTVRERTNLMDIDPSELDPRPVFAVADLSFRSLRGAASKLLAITGGNTALALVKPQFEQPDEEGFTGIVRTAKARNAVIRALLSDLTSEGVHVLDAAVSSIRGRKGNAEIFLILSAVPAENREFVNSSIEQALEEAGRKVPAT
jgi:23S rRNA (cytidine1920-2'-O)/16S rRNA (cytidine1409-2'-O)-methyltransferase